MRKIEAKSEDCIWFYWEGWRWGEIIKRYSDDLLTVKDCNKSRHRVRRNNKGKWVSFRHKDFKEQKKVRGEENGKKEKSKKIKGKRRLKVKIKRRIVCNGKENT